jgi:hypothetical protein
MFFSKKKREAPPINDEAKYVAWFVEYSDELADLRRLFGKDVFVGPSTRAALRELSKFPNPDALFDEWTKLATTYQTKAKPMIDKKGGLHRCSQEVMITIAGIMVNMTVIQEMLTKRYKHPQAIDLLNIFNDKS